MFRASCIRTIVRLAALQGKGEMSAGHCSGPGGEVRNDAALVVERFGAADDVGALSLCATAI